MGAGRTGCHVGEPARRSALKLEVRERRRAKTGGGAMMEDGGWRMENGGWRMENGGWRMEDGEWQARHPESAIHRGEGPLSSRMRRCRWFARP
ncbi:MAG: hypothetical protein WBW88_01890 [Rhodothermales bacterium]